MREVFGRIKDSLHDGLHTGYDAINVVHEKFDHYRASLEGVGGAASLYQSSSDIGKAILPVVYADKGWHAVDHYLREHHPEWFSHPDDLKESKDPPPHEATEPVSEKPSEVEAKRTDNESDKKVVSDMPASQSQAGNLTMDFKPGSQHQSKDPDRGYIETDPVLEVAKDGKKEILRGEHGIMDIKAEVANAAYKAGTIENPTIKQILQDPAGVGDQSPGGGGEAGGGPIPKTDMKLDKTVGEIKLPSGGWRKDFDKQFEPEPGKSEGVVAETKTESGNWKKDFDRQFEPTQFEPTARERSNGTPSGSPARLGDQDGVAEMGKTDLLSSDNKSAASKDKAPDTSVVDGVGSAMETTEKGDKQAHENNAADRVSESKADQDKDKDKGNMESSNSW
jgi:hypothetical protein